MSIARLALLILLATLSGPIAFGSPDPPKAERIPHKIVAPHGHTREDPYYWLRERDNPKVISYLNAENAYTEATMAGTKPLQETLFNEIVGRIKQDDSSVPYRYKNYEYYTRYRKGASYPLHCRKRVGSEKEEILFDVPAMAKGHKFYSLHEGEISHNESIIAFAVR